MGDLGIRAGKTRHGYFCMRINGRFISGYEAVQVPFVNDHRLPRNACADDRTDLAHITNRLWWGKYKWPFPAATKHQNRIYFRGRGKGKRRILEACLCVCASCACSSYSLSTQISSLAQGCYLDIFIQQPDTVRERPCFTFNPGPFFDLRYLFLFLRHNPNQQG